jgi:hypothetical protein
MVTLNSKRPLRKPLQKPKSVVKLLLTVKNN